MKGFGVNDLKLFKSVISNEFACNLEGMDVIRQAFIKEKEMAVTRWAWDDRAYKSAVDMSLFVLNFCWQISITPRTSKENL